MKMKIPIVDPTNIYNNHESSNDFMASENNDISQPEEADSPTADDDFSEYLWMENEEEFDKQVCGCILKAWFVATCTHWLKIQLV